jgi:hypothetical protein
MVRKYNQNTQLDIFPFSNLPVLQYVVFYRQKLSIENMSKLF